MYEYFVLSLGFATPLLKKAEFSVVQCTALLYWLVFTPTGWSDGVALW